MLGHFCCGALWGPECQWNSPFRVQQLQVSGPSQETLFPSRRASAFYAQGPLSSPQWGSWGSFHALCSPSKALDAPAQALQNAKVNTYTQVGSSSCTRNLQVPWKQKVLWASGQLLKWDLTAAATGGPKSPKGFINFHIYIKTNSEYLKTSIPTCFLGTFLISLEYFQIAQNVLFKCTLW